MDSFRVGDVVIYCHPEAPPEGRGALAIITNVKPESVDVQWLTRNEYIGFGEDSWLKNCWDLNSFELIGHIEVDNG